MCPEPRARPAFCALLPSLAAALLLSACAVPTPPAPAPPAREAPPVQLPPPAPPPPVAKEVPAAPPPPAMSMPVQGGQPGAVVPDGRTAQLAVLAHSDRLRRMPPNELAQELARLSEIPEAQRQPGEDMQLALALAQTRAPADLARAQVLLQRVIANPREDARGLQPLAALLLARFAEQRRVEDLLDKQTQQVREQQRRIEQLNERLEAVRAIERSLTSRPAPANGTPRTTPP